MSLIHDIQAAAISDEKTVATLLRMCKLLAARISHEQLEQWVNWELNGYPSFDKLPDYRIASVESYGSFVGAGAQADRLQVPVSVLPDELQERYRYAYLDSNISTYESLLEGDSSGTLQSPWPLNLAVHHASELMVGMQCVRAWKEIPKGAIVRLIDSVKTRILSYAIDLEREAPNAGDTPIGSKAPLSDEKMTQIFNTNISGSVANLSNSGENFSQASNAIPVHTGDWDSFLKHLSAMGLSETELNAVKPELDEVSESADKNLVIRLSEKLSSKAGEIGSKVAPAVITKAITQYLGLS